MVTVALDARTVYSARRRGTGKNLLDAYSVLAQIRPDWRFLLYHRSPNGERPFAGFENVNERQIDMPGDRWDLWQQLRLPLAARRADILHCPANSCPRYGTVPVVSTIHDLIPLKVHECQRDADRFAAGLRRCLRRSRRVITVSHSTKQDLISDFGADPQRIDVVYWAPDSASQVVRDEARLATLRARYNINGRYLLAFSGQSRRKNALGMIHGYKLMEPQRHPDLQFVFVGVEPAAYRSALQQTIRDLDLQDRCRLFGFVPEADVAGLLSAAEGLAYCSLYEGFGLPILDAFSCQTPVLTSEISSMPEVAGDAAIYCNPHDPVSIATGMAKLVGNPQLRGTLVRRGLSRVRQFTWQRTATTLCEVFEKCL